MTQGVLEAAMSLPPEERAELAERLWESLPGEITDIAFAEDLAQEVRSRRERYLRGASQLHPWDDVRTEMDGIREATEWYAARDPKAATRFG